MSSDAPNLPHRPQSEQFLLACTLINPDVLPRVASELPDPEMFYPGFYQRVYALMLDQLSQGLQPDLLTLEDPKSAISTGTLLEILVTLPEEFFVHTRFGSQPAIETHAKLIRDAYLKRQAQAALERGESAEAVLQQLSSLAQHGHDRAFNAAQIADLFYAQLTDRPDRIAFPFRELNRATAGGMRRGEMIIVAARQGQGKSALLQNITLNAIEAGKRVLFVSAEMGSTDLAGRWLTMMSHQQVLRPEQTIDLDRATEAIAQMHDWGDRLMVHELVNVAGIEQALKDAPGTIDLVCVDYLQKLTPMNPRLKSEYERVSEVSRTLDNLCQRYQVPMVVAAQFNRRAEGQQPSIADIRDSGSIEADADMVISLWEKPGQANGRGPTKVCVDILKNRNGYTLHNSDTNEYALWFDKPHFLFYDVERRAE